MNKKTQLNGLDVVVVKTPLGPVSVCAGERGIKYVFFDKNLKAVNNPRLKKAQTWIENYFEGSDTPFPWEDLDLSGYSKFQQSLWKRLWKIKRSQIVSYGALADDLGIPGGARAVGGACGANPVLLLIPCHRVVTSNGRLGGFSGGLGVKEKLLGLEGIDLDERGRLFRNAVCN